MPQPNPALTHDEQLVQFLRGRAMSCPGCGYNLRDLKERRCPECGRPIRLSISAPEPSPAAWISGLVLLSMVAGMGLTWAIIFGPIRFIFSFPSDLLLDVSAISSWMSSPALLLWLALRRPMLRLPAAAQWCLVVGTVLWWGVCFGSMTLQRMSEGW